MKNLPAFRAIKRWSSRLGSLLLMFQKSPLIQMLFPQANFLTSSVALNSTGFAIATVVGLGAYDSVAGATVVSQLSPAPGSSDVGATVGANVNAVFHITGGATNGSVQSWSITNGALPSGLTLANIQGSNTTNITGTVSAAQVGNYPIRITAWQFDDFSGDRVDGNFTVRVSLGTPAGIGTHPGSATINSGQTASLTVVATGSSPFTYQWYQGASGVTTTPVGANSSSYTTPVLTVTTSYWVKVTNAANSTGANSNTATITVRQPAAISAHPQSIAINSGETTQLSVTATGDAPLTYQWYQGTSGVTTTPVGTNSPSFTTPALTANTNYWVKVSNIANPSGANSNTATVSILQPPAITTPPASVAINAGQTTMLSVVATGAEPLTYQWYQGASGVTTTPVGTNSATFTTPALNATTSYWVRVSNSVNPSGVDSPAATVTVLLVTPPWAHALSELTEAVMPSARDATGTTFFGWAIFNEIGARNQPIDDDTPDIGNTTVGPVFKTTNSEDHVLDGGQFSFTSGTLAEQIIVPTDGTVGQDGYTTLILQIVAPPDSGPFPAPILLGSINGVAPTVVQGVNANGNGQLWAKWQLPGNEATYTIDLAGSGAQGGFHFDNVIVDTLYSESAYMPDTMTATMPAISTTSPLPFGIVGSAYSQQIAATGGAGPYQFQLSAGALPAGLSLSSTGLISGTPTAAGGASFTVLVADSTILTKTKEFSLNITTMPVITTSQTLPAGVAGTAYNQNLAVTGGTASYTWSLSSGDLPDGITLSSAGVLSGTPNAAGVSNFTIEVEDGNGLTDTESFSLTISSLAIATASLPTAVKGVAYTPNLSATGGSPPYTWTVTAGTLPTGISLSSAGVFSGTPTAASTAPLTIKVTDSTNFFVTKQLTLTVSAVFLRPEIQPINFPTVTIGADFSYTITALNYPKTFSIAGLPSGLKAAPATGVITGRPAASGVFNVQVRATNAGGFSSLVTARLTVKALDKNLVGTFGGLIARDVGINRNLGGMLTVTTTSNGSFSVKCTSALANSATKGGSASYTATGFLKAAPPQIAVTVGGQTLTLSLSSATGQMTGTLGTAAVTGWRSAWHAQMNPADHLQGYYSLALDLTNAPDRTNPAIPQGTGFATFSVPASGAFSVVGKTADGEAITGSTFLGANGEFWIYTSVYKNQGTIQGLLNLTEDPDGLFAGNTVLGAMTWFKPATIAKSYAATFGPTDVTAEGAYLAPANKGNVVLGLPDPGPVNLSFTDGGLSNSMTNPDLAFNYTDDNKVLLPTAPGANPGKVALTINTATGAVAGNFSLEETAPPFKRSKVPFLGQIVRLSDGEVKAAGYFMLPQIPTGGQTAANAPSLSGAFSLLQPAD